MLARTKKINILHRLAKLLESEGVETEKQLADWLQQQDRKEVLCAIPGIGLKTYDYLWLLCDLEAVAVDVHLYRFAEHAGVRGDYQHIRAVTAQAAKLMNCSQARLDNAIWQYQSKKK